jgi:hypothetical protein
MSNKTYLLLYFRYAALLEDENKGGENLFLNHLKIKIKLRLKTTYL